MNVEVSQTCDGDKFTSKICQILGFIQEKPLQTCQSHTANTMNLSGYEDLGVSPLENIHVAKRTRYLNPNSTIWPMGLGLVTSLFKYKRKKPSILNNHFDKLPEEVFLQIFRLLDKRNLIKCAHVCSKWRRIVYDESLWQCVNIPCRRMDIMTLDNLLKRNVKFLSISHANIYVNMDNYTFESPFSKLQYLDMSAAFMPLKILNSLLSQCSNLLKLSLENCQVDHACCENIGRNTKLKVLNLASASGLDNIGLSHILSLKNLEELNVSWASMKTEDLQYLMNNIKPNLKRLNISGFMKQLSDSDLMSMVSCCQQLIELDISDSLAITAKSLDYILHNQPNLRVLSMSRCYNVGSAYLQPNTLKEKLDNSTHQLKELNVFGIANQPIFNTVCAYLLDFDINKSMFSSIARPKLADNEHTIWEISVSIDC